MFRRYKKGAKTRICFNCGVRKKIDKFAKQAECTDGRAGICHKCRAAQSKKYRREHPVYERKRQKYNSIYAGCKRAGISTKQYFEMFRAQNGKCAICGVSHLELDRLLSIDHDHNVEIIRGLLCNNCNAGLGLFRDNPNMLASAIKYLEKYTKVKV